MVKTSIIRAEFSPLSVARMLWKRKYSIVLIWVAVSAIGVYQVKKIPAVYSAEALVFIDSQKIPEKYVSSTVSTDVQGRFDSITQQILSRTRLTQIIRDFDLYHEQRKVRYPEEILDLMRNDISITPLRGSRGPGAFQVAYQGRDPAVVAAVANRIANLYVEENLKTREVQAEGTSEFLDAQLKDAKKGLDEMEAAVSAFKARHNGELPQQEGAIASALSRLQVELQANRDELNRAQESKVLLENSLSMAQETLAVQQRALEAAAAASRASAAGPAAAPAGAAAPVRRSAELEAQLESLRLRYNDAHPEIRRMEAELRVAREEERREQAAARPQAQPAGESPHVTAPAEAPAVSVQLSQARERVATLRSQLTLNSQDIQNRKAEQRRILSQIEMYQERMGRLPLREQELARITRDYEISKANYRSLVDKKMSAEMASEMERRQKSERFTIGDPARVPDMPIRPNRKLYAAIVSMFGLLLGLIWGGANELRKDVLLGEWELPASVPILGRVPAMELGSDEGAGGKRRLLVVSSAALSVLGVLAAGIYFAIYRS